MTKPIEMAKLIKSRIGQDFSGECHLTEEEANIIINLLTSNVSVPREPSERQISAGIAAWPFESSAPFTAVYRIYKAMTGES